MKKILIRELFWFVVSFILSLFLSFIFVGIYNLTSSDRILNEVEMVFTVQIYLIGCLVSFIIVYIVRLIVATIKMLIT